MIYRKKKNLWITLLTGYTFLVLSGTLIARIPSENPGFELMPLWSYLRWNENKEHIILNIMMFLPIGFLAAKLWKFKALPMAALLSTTIELVQFLTKRGFMDIDDIINNTLGALFGILLYKTADLLYRSLQNESQK